MLRHDSLLYKIASFFWRKYISKIKPIADFIEIKIIYPKLNYISRKNSYPFGPVLIAGYFKSTIGQGVGAELFYEDCKKQGIEVYAIDVSSPFGLEDKQNSIPLCTLKNAPKHGNLIIHCNAPEMGRALQYLGEDLTSNRKIIGYWAWELEVPPRNWHKAFAYCDEVWVPSNFTAKSFANASIPIKVVPHIVKSLPDAGHSLKDLALLEISDDTTCFLIMADCRSDLIRKNVYGSMKAFALGAGNNMKAILIVKLHYTEFGNEELQKLYNLCEQYHNIFIIDKIFSSEECGSLVHLCDVLISLHRAEGYGLHLAEALKIGKKVIATNYSGNIDFMNNENSILVPYTLVPVIGDTYNYKAYDKAMWAEADVEFVANEIKKIIFERE